MSDEIDDTAPDPSASPVSPAPEPPGDFANDPFWQSPSTWITLSTLLAPLLTYIFKEHAPKVIEAIVTAGPIVAGLVLVVQRNMNHRNVQQLNASLAHQRMSILPPVVESTVLPAMDFAGAEIQQLKDEMQDVQRLLTNQVIPALTAATTPRRRGGSAGPGAERIK